MDFQDSLCLNRVQGQNGKAMVRCWPQTNSFVLADAITVIAKILWI